MTTWQSARALVEGWGAGLAAVCAFMVRSGGLVFHQEVFVFRYGDARFGPQPPRIGLLALYPGEQRRGEVGAGGVRERVRGADPRVEVDHVDVVPGHEQVAFQHAEVAELLAEDPADRLQPSIGDARGAVGLPVPHAELAP